MRVQRIKAFLSTPSGWRATFYPFAAMLVFLISIHALRVEGDLIFSAVCLTASYFYPRPPGGGRPPVWATLSTLLYFYPRPPGGGRLSVFIRICAAHKFLSTPSGWRATFDADKTAHEAKFLSTPSGWRATKVSTGRSSSISISIHALRVEGDLSCGDRWAGVRPISIHALRVEGDIAFAGADLWESIEFLSTPSGWRATIEVRHAHSVQYDFYPRPPGGGRRVLDDRLSA